MGAFARQVARPWGIIIVEDEEEEEEEEEEDEEEDEGEGCLVIICGNKATNR